MASMSSNSKFISNFSVDDFTSNHQLDFYNYYIQICGEKIIPARADIKPIDIVKILPHLMLLEKKADDFNIRLMGTRCAEVLGENTGKNLNHYEGASDVIERLNWSMEHKKPFYHMRPLDKFNKKHTNSSALVMPLSNNNCHVNMFILVHHFF